MTPTKSTPISNPNVSHKRNKTIAQTRKTLHHCVIYFIYTSQARLLIILNFCGQGHDGIILYHCNTLCHSVFASHWLVSYVMYLARWIFGLIICDLDEYHGSGYIFVVFETVWCAVGHGGLLECLGCNQISCNFAVYTVTIAVASKLLLT